MDNPKTIRFSVCLDTETEKRLQTYCDENKITKGEAIRKGVELLLSKENGNA